MTALDVRGTARPARAALRWAARLIGGAVLLALGLVAVGVMLAALVGLRPLSLLSDSMGPRILAGDVVLAKADDGTAAEVGDIVAFLPYADNPTLLIHRVIDVERDEAGAVVALTTQGDANGAADRPISPEQVRFAVVDGIVIPKLGHLLVPLESTPPQSVFLGAALVAVLGMLLWFAGARPARADADAEDASARTIEPGDAAGSTLERPARDCPRRSATRGALVPESQIKEGP